MRKAKQEEQKRKLSQGKGPIADPVETFIDRAKKQGTEKQKERAERMQFVLRSNKAKSDIRELKETLRLLESYTTPDLERRYTNIDSQFLRTDEQKKREAIDKLLDVDFEKVEDIYDKIIKGSESDTFLNSEADFVKDIEVDITTHMYDKDVAERNRKIVEERVKEKTAKGIKTTFEKEWAAFVNEDVRSRDASDLFADKKKTHYRR